MEETKIYKVTQFSNNGVTRNVEIPISELQGKPNHEILRLVYEYGQNDIQHNDKHPSVSTGDIVDLEGQRWVIARYGFIRITSEEWNHMAQAHFQAKAEKISFSEALYSRLGVKTFQLIG